MFSNGNLFVCLFIVSIQLHHTSLLLSAEAETIRRSNSTNILHNNATRAATATLAKTTATPIDDDDVRRVSETIVDGAASFMAKPEPDATELANYTKSTSNHQGHYRTATTTTEAGFRIELSQGDIEYEQLPEPMALFGLDEPGSVGSSNGLHHLHQSPHRRTPAVAATDGLLSGPLPVFPERSDAVYFVVAVIGGAKVWSRTLARSLMEMGPPFGSPLGPPLRPLYVDLPPNGRFSVKVLTSLCQQTDGVPLAGVVVIGDGQSARAIAIAGHSMRIPVLWARGGTANIHSTQSEYHATLQSILQPSAREILEAIRALFLQTHWHSFFVLSDVEATMVLAGTEGLPLKQPPLKPTILPLPPADGNVFRQLAEISRSTRGIILLLCNLVSARNVMSEAKRLNMAGGHFIWLWADTSSTAEFFDVNKSPSSLVDPTNDDILVDVDRAAEKLINYPAAVNKFTKTDTDVVDTTGRSAHPGSLPQYRQHTPPTGFHQRGGFDTSWSPFHNSVESQKTGSTAGEASFKIKESPASSSEGRYQIGLGEDSYESSESVNAQLIDDVSTKPNRMVIPFSDEEEYSDEEDDPNPGDEEDEDELKKRNFRQFFESHHPDPDPYNNLLQSGITVNETSNHQSPKPKRTSSIHYGINASAASSHVLFHHFKDFPVGLLALRPVKMKVDQAFIRSTIRLFASTWAQVQINAVREQEKNRQRVSINPYGDNMSWLPMGRDQMSLQGRRRRRRGRRRRKRRSIDDGSNEQDVIVNSKQKAKHNSVHIGDSSSSNSIKFRSDNTNSSRDSTNRTNSKLNINRSGDSNKLNSSFYIHNKNNNSRPDVASTSPSNSGWSSSNSSENSNKSSTNSSSGSYNQNLSGLTNQNNQQPPSEGITITNNQSNTKAPSAESLVLPTDGSSEATVKIKRASRSWTTAKRVNAGGGRRRMGDDDLVSDDIDSKMAPGERMAIDDGEHLGTPYFMGGCFGSSSRIDERRAELFARALKASTAQAMSGELTVDGGHREHPLITKFEILNLVPDGGRHTERQLFDGDMSSRHRNHHHPSQQQQQPPKRQQQAKQPRYPSTKWRRVGLIAGRNVHLDTIVWPGGDIVVSGLSAKSRTIFRVVTALAPPFVMASELDEDGLCLRGLPCHRLLPNHKHNLTIMFNNIETQHRFTEDILEHGGKVPSDQTGNFPKPKYETKCCYGLSMDLLDNIATELEFEFHLYIVHDELFGAKFSTLDDFMPGRVPFKGATYHRNTVTTTTGGTTGKRQQQQHQRSKDASAAMDVNNQYQQSLNQQQQQRRYHSPEGRTRTRRRTSSASFERENSLNSNEAVATPSVPDAMKQQRAILKRQQQRQMTSATNDDGMTSQTEVDTSDTAAEMMSEDTGTVDDAVEDVSLNDESPSYHNDYHDDQEQPQTDDELIDDTAGSEYLVNGKRVQWNGIIGDLISGSADMSFAPLTVSRARAEVIDFSAPYFHGGVSLLAAPQGKSEIPLLAFLLPFSPELWIAIFTSLNVTAIAVAIYEWLSPFGLNPWGRQRSKNFSMSSALWVMWGLLCGHLVAFKAPKSWPNKFLINVWGGFSVIFIASYTANIAALIAGLFFHNAGNTPEVSLFTQRVGAPLSSSTESFLKQHRPHEWEHIKKYTLRNIEEGIRGLKNGTLDLLIGDTPILDYYRAIDHGCNLLRVGETYVEDTYAIGMKKGFPLKDSISALIAKYSSNGYLDILTEKWYGGLPCFKLDNDIIMPRPLGVAAVAGVFLLLGLGITVGVLILIFEHWFYKFMLPKLRHKPKGTVWRSRNIMFFSQKLYRFINCVELVSPHHAARELVHTLRQGQIASLFQKSIKRKEDEQRRRRKSKAQFFEMIQEIRRVQQAEKMKTKLEVLNEHGEHEGHGMQIPEIITPHSRSPKPRSSPRSKLFSSKHKRSRSNSSTLSVRRFSNDSILSDRLDTIGRRLSRDLTNSPPDFGRRFDTLSATNTGSGSTVKFDISSAKDLSTDRIEETKFDTYGGKELKVPTKKHQNRRAQINPDTFKPAGKETSAESSSNSTDSPTVQLLPVLREGLTQEDTSAQTLLHDQIHEELVTKYGECDYEVIVPLSDSSPPQTASQRTSFRSSSRSPPNLSRHRQRSLDGLEQRPKMPSPPRSSLDSDTPQVSASRSNIPENSHERLSRENLLRLNESTQSEYLSKPAAERSALEPP